MKRKLLGLLLSISMWGTIGCGEPIQVEKVPAIATIVDTRYTPSFKTPTYNVSIKIWTCVYHPADYDTYIEYNNTLYNFDSKEIYDMCHGKNGQKIDVIYIMKYYKNGKIKTSIELEGGIK